MAAVIRPASFRDILAARECDALMREYASECSQPELGPIEPKAELYARLEHSGAFQSFGVYDGTKLIGFIALMVYPLPHYGGRRIVATESVFLSEPYRNQGIWPKMMATIKDYAKSHDCYVVQCSAPVGSRFARLLDLNVKQFRRSNVVYLWAL